MSQPPLDNQRQEPRAFAYGRGNQAAGRYRSPVPRPADPSPTAAAPARIGANRRRYWLFAMLLVLILGVGAATLSAVFAGQTPTALAPDGAAMAPVQVAPPAPPTPRTTARPTTAAPPAQPRAKTGTARSTTAATSTPPTAQPVVAPTPGAVVYRNCNQARRAGVTPLHRGDPGYSAKLDRDGDGIACEKNKD
ncbi:excalibur calcium-binding domain-containing protein [Micromonospora sp. NPDC049523]|uniref:excalibur calcium-binding domain-containing protein n=1 Tax=Micromonospora sp. NPDC049523 TaxID=3155921 RepID=UPI0034258FFD